MKEQTVPFGCTCTMNNKFGQGFRTAV